MADSIIQQKQCPMCKVVKTRDHFPRNAGRKDGLNPYCKSCIREKTRGARHVNPNEGMSALSENTIRRFWKQIAIAGPDDCWLWHGRQTKGYGSIHFTRGAWDYTHAYAHRVAYFLANGTFNESLLVCHSCDTPLCCNARHLFLGTHSENMEDAVFKERTATGSRHGRSKLTEDQVKEIRRLANGGILNKELADNFQISPHMISRIVKRHNWKHI